MADLKVTQETIDLAKQALQQPLAKDAVTQGYTTATGITGYNLERPAKSLFPVLAPFRNSLPRVKAPIGAPAAHWKAITGINVTNQRATTGFGYAGNLVSTAEKDFMAAYQVISLGDSVQYDAQIQAEGFQDLRATAGINLLYALMEQEDIIDLGGQNFSLGTPSTPTLTVSSTGGTIGAVNVGVAVAARTLQGYYDGKNTAASTPATSGTLSGSTNSITATVAYVPGAVVYDWYVGNAGGTLYYYTSTSVNKVTITSVPTAAQAVPTATLPMLGTPSSTAPTVDQSADPNAYNGLIATLTGSYNNGTFVSAGQGQPSGAYVKSLDGATLTGSNGTIAEIDAALQYLWGNAKLSPTKMLCNSVDHMNISNKIIASGGAYTMFRPNDIGERQTVVGGQLVETYLNKAVNGRAIPIETHPWLPQGTIIFLTEKLPYPNNLVANVMEVETLLEYTQIEYATSRYAGQAGGGPRYDFEVRAQQVFKNYFPGSMAILQNVANG
jgi:hypothetical protein